MTSDDQVPFDARADYDEIARLRAWHLARVAAIDQAAAELRKAVEVLQELEFFEPARAAAKILPEALAGRYRRNPVAPSEIVEHACTILAERGRPMTRAELVHSLAARGIPIAGPDPRKSLGSILWRFRKVVARIEGQGYWPVGRDLPAD